MQKEDARKSKGYAFLEFEGYDHMKTCLKLFHHSNFDDGISPPRKISVELTYVAPPLVQVLCSHVRCSAGGGGNTKDRKDKIKAKNNKLNEERVRRIQEEAKTKAAKSGGAMDESSIHPSRRTQVPGG
jgi:nucleolar protein 6